MKNESACVAPSTIGGKKLTAKSFRPKPFKVERFLQSGGKLVRIAPISTDETGLRITTIFSNANIEQAPKKPHSRINAQSRRMADAFRAAPDTDISSVDLHRIGSGKENGWLASFSRRISDLRAQNLNVVKSIDKVVLGQRQTSYRLIKNVEAYE